MIPLLITLATTALQMPCAETFEDYAWKPHFTKPAEFEPGQTVAFFTHASRHFDPTENTKPAVVRVAETMKTAGLQVVYLHDQYNSNNPAWMYLYDDFRPSAFIGSDVGHIDLNFEQVRHVVSLGGYFGQCQRSTVADSIRCWRRDAPDDDLRITQIVNGIFCVNEFMNSADPYYKPVREYFYATLRERHPRAVIRVDETLRYIDEPEAQAKFLSRQLPPVPTDVHIVMDVMGTPYTVQVAKDEDAPVLTFAYRRSDEFLQFQSSVVDAENVLTVRLNHRFRSLPRRIKPRPAVRDSTSSPPKRLQ